MAVEGIALVECPKVPGVSEPKYTDSAPCFLGQRRVMVKGSGQGPRVPICYFLDR